MIPNGLYRVIIGLDFFKKKMAMKKSLLFDFDSINKIQHGCNEPFKLERKKK